MLPGVWEVKGMGGHHQPNEGKSNVWLTPPELIESLGEFDLDPCAASLPRPWKTARSHYSLPLHDGLTLPWFGRVWLNPPYGQQTWQWLERLAKHGSGIALIFARTETKGFFDQVWRKAEAILFIEGRLFFHRQDGSRADHNSGAPSCLVAYSPEDAEVLSRLDIGAFVSGWSA